MWGEHREKLFLMGWVVAPLGYLGGGLFMPEAQGWACVTKFLLLKMLLLY